MSRPKGEKADKHPIGYAPEPNAPIPNRGVKRNLWFLEGGEILWSVSSLLGGKAMPRSVESEKTKRKNLEGMAKFIARTLGVSR